MTDPTLASHPVRIATEALRALDVHIRAPIFLADAVVAALDAAGWLHDPADTSGRDAIDYVGKIARLLGVPDPADVRRGKYRLERVGEAALAEIERMRVLLAARARLAALEAVAEAARPVEAAVSSWSANGVRVTRELAAALAALDAVPAAETGASRKGWPDPIRTRTTADMGSQLMAAPCRSCGRPFSPTHDAGAPGPTSRHPFTPAAETGGGEAW